MAEIVTAAMLVIGDEILSGRTKDKNIGHLADVMTAIGIDLKEVRIVPDEEGRDRRCGQCGPRPLHLRLHHRRHWPDPRRHHRRFHLQGVRRAVRIRYEGSTR